MDLGHETFGRWQCHAILLAPLVSQPDRYNKYMDMLDLSGGSLCSFCLSISLRLPSPFETYQNIHVVLSKISHDIHWSTFSPWIAAIHWGKFLIFGENPCGKFVATWGFRAISAPSLQFCCDFCGCGWRWHLRRCHHQYSFRPLIRNSWWILWGQESQRFGLSLNIFNQHLLNGWKE